MSEKLSRQQRRKINRNYAKRFEKARGMGDTETLLPEQEHVKPGSDVWCFPSFQMLSYESEIDYDQGFRSFGETIGKWHRVVPPSVIFIMVFRPHPFESDKVVENMGRTIISKYENENVLSFIFSDESDFVNADKSIDKEKLAEVSDNLIEVYIEENRKEVYENLNIIVERLRS